jgi:transposase
MPEKYPPYQTCHRRFQEWVRTGQLEEALKQLARHLHERRQLNLEEAFVDATFASAKKGAPPNRGNRSSSQGGRKLRRYCKRWKVERLFAWLHNFRRLVTRWEYHIENFLGFVHLACPTC